ncbi:DNA/RNA polymerase [Rozella allomycis CSF55]|uniref:DNA repair protein REV1 n=1 Tax=Rozella allomycis (strain CSF55) TaxID=988480 RepID=A0A4P9YP37_ROZAC|nr:DNA/RNA polymerase [Rozella allomycis CSF55]
MNQSSKSDKRKEKEPAYESYDQYFQEKKRKLEQQNSCTLKTNIFHGLVFHVNGYTNPPLTTVRDLVCEHGGRYAQYLSREVTHIVCTNLPMAKLKLLKQSDVIIKPEWILDCIKKGGLVDERPYRVYEHNSLNNQKTLVLPTAKAENSERESRIDASDPNFVAQFYQNSRLHFLSLWKNELKEFTAEFLKNKKDNIHGAYKVILHVDMDSFFVSVALKDRQNLIDKPVAVGHSTRDGKESNKLDSSSDLASCNYVARQFGVRNGMMLQKALKLCPGLIVLPYEFEKYREISRKFYTVLFKYADNIQAVSCDEAFLEINSKLNDDSKETVYDICENIRKDIRDICEVNASIGAGPNMLIARLATKKAKPNGQHYVTKEEIKDFIKDISVKDLPSVGYAHGSQFETMGIETCSQLEQLTISELQKIFGIKEGELFYNYCRGIDSRELINTHERKSIGAEINWGIRLNEKSKVESFFRNLSKEVSERLISSSLSGKLLTLKVKCRKRDAEQPRKHMGHGWCDDISKSHEFSRPVFEENVIFTQVIKMYNGLHLAPEDLRGAGIHFQKLVDIKNAKDQKKLDFSNMKKREINHIMKNNKSEVEIISSSDIPKHSHEKNPSKQKAFQKLSPKGKPPFKPLITLTQKFKPRKLFSDVIELSDSDDTINLNIDIDILSSQSHTQTQNYLIYPDLDGFIDESEIKSRLKQWVDCFKDEGPLDIDKRTIFTYFSELFDSKNLDLVRKYFCYLKRLTKEIESEKWLSFLTDLENQLQLMSINNYGSKLLL